LKTKKLQLELKKIKKMAKKCKEGDRKEDLSTNYGF